MKERVILFSDAVYAIVLTLMVIDIPITITGGDIDWRALAGTIGIYLVSFCFVVNLWFQTAQAFERVTVIPNGPLMVYLLSLFLLSLVPKATELIVEEVTRQMVLVYGVLTLVLMLVIQWLFLLLMRCRDDEDIEVVALERRSLIRRGAIDLSLRLVVIVISFFFPAVGVGIYLFVPLVSLVSTIVDTNEGTFVESLDADEQDAYLAERGRVWRNPVARYGMFLGDVAGVGSDPTQSHGPEWSRDLDERWRGELRRSVQELHAATVSAQKEEGKRGRADSETRVMDDVDKVRRNAAERAQETRKREVEAEGELREKLDGIDRERRDLEERLEKAANPKDADRIRRRLERLLINREKELIDYENRKRRIEIRALDDIRDGHREMRKIARKAGKASGH